MIEKIIQNYKYPPIQNRLKEMPKKLVFYKKSAEKKHDFVLFTTHQPWLKSVMYCIETTRDYDNQKSLLIASLYSSPKKQGLGTEMLNIAKIFSKKLGYEGRFHLFADPQFTMTEVPHIFYRKYGMSSDSPELNNKLDDFIKNKKRATIKDFKRTVMYYPPLYSSSTPINTPQQTLLTKLKSLISKLLNI